MKGGVLLNYSKLEGLMKKKGVTAYRVAKETGIKASSISQWKKGDCKPKIDKLKILADYFDVSIEYFL